MGHSTAGAKHTHSTAATLAALMVTAASASASAQALQSGVASSPKSPVAGVQEADEPTAKPPAPAHAAPALAAPIEVSFLGGVTARPAASSKVRYEPGAAWAGSARVALTDWFGIALTGGRESHDVWLQEGALGLTERLAQPTLRGLQVGASASARTRILPRLFGEFGVGVAWARFTAPPVTNSDDTLIASARSGVVVTLPLTPRLMFIAVPGRLAISALGTVGFALPGQSGKLFAHDGGNDQAVRQDTGTLVTVGGLPPFEHSYGGFLSVDLLL